jgi:acetyltransferase (GNAT) family protein
MATLGQPSGEQSPEPPSVSEPPIVLSAQRTYSNSISMFCSYVSDGRYGWISFCEKQFGDAPAQICFESNTPQHEVAVVVAHNEHLRGVGTALLRRLGEIARENGVHHLIAEVLAGEPSDASGHDGRRLAVHATP